VRPRQPLRGAPAHMIHLTANGAFLWRSGFQRPAIDLAVPDAFPLVKKPLTHSALRRYCQGVLDMRRVHDCVETQEED
jgi:hypothetical protein